MKADGAVVMAGWMLDIRSATTRALLVVLAEASRKLKRSKVAVCIAEVARELGVSRQMLTRSAQQLEDRAIAVRDVWKPGIWYVNPAMRVDITTDEGYRQSEVFQDMVRLMKKHRRDSGGQWMDAKKRLPAGEFQLLDEGRGI